MKSHEGILNKKKEKKTQTSWKIKKYRKHEDQEEDRVLLEMCK